MDEVTYTHRSFRMVSEKTVCAVEDMTVMYCRDQCSTKNII